MRKVLSNRAQFEIDLELPTECWDREEIDEDSANLMRLTYMAGYIQATRDAKSGKLGNLITRVSRLQAKEKV